MKALKSFALATISWLLAPGWFLAQHAAAQPIAPGFPNVAQTPGAILSGLNAPYQGRTAILAFHNGLLFTVPELPSSEAGSDFQVRTWNISDPTDPVIVDTLGISPMPINAHGYFKSSDYLILGANWPPEAPWSFQANGPGVFNRTEFPELRSAGVRGDLFGPWFAGETYWSYDEVAGDTVLALDNVELASWDHLGLTGVIGHPFLLGDLLIFASDQSRTGVATYNISDPSNPVLLDVLTHGGPGGYWPEIWGSGDGRLYIVFPYRTGGNGFRVVDATDPSDLQFVTDHPLTGAESMYIQFQDEYAFMGSHKVDMRTFQSVLDLNGANTVRPSDGGTGIDTSQFLLPVGNLLVTGGSGPNQGMAIWAHQAAPDTRGPSVGYHIPQAGRTNYPLGAPISVLIHETLETATIIPGNTFIVRPLGGGAISGGWVFSFNDVLTFTPDAPLTANTTYEVVFTDGGIRDVAGNGMVGYSYTFSTGSAVGGNAPPSVTSLAASTHPVAPGAAFNLTATATDPESAALEYRFDFGDGAPKTAWSSSASIQHTYINSGHYQASVQARDPGGALASGTLTVTAAVAPAGPRPTSSSPVVCDDGSRRVWTVNPDNDTLASLDADTLASAFEVGVCDDPRSLALSSENEIWVACHDDDRIAVLDANTGTTVANLSTGYGSAPVAIAFSPDGATAFVAFEGNGDLRRYNAASRTQTGSLTLGLRPKALAVSGDGSRVLVTRFISPRNWAEVWDVDAAGMTLSSTMRLTKFGGDEHRDTTASGKGVANYLAGVTFTPDSQNAFVASQKANTDRGLTFAEDLDSDNTVRNILSRLDLGGGFGPGDNRVESSIDLDNSDSAVAAAYSPLGDYLFVAMQGAGEVMVLDALDIEEASGLGSLVTRWGAGLAPQGLCVDGVTHRVFVKNFMDRSLTVIEAEDLFRVGDKTVPSSELPTVASEVLSAEVLLGKQIFHNAGDPRMSAEGYISCATCHADGGHDGRVWDFTGRGEGLRNTTTLRGKGGTAQGNVHWTANFDEVQDFEHDIRGPFGGAGLMSNADFAATNTTLGPAKAGLSADLDALAAYVQSLSQDSLPRSPHRNADGTMTAQGEAGRGVFESLGCRTCHAGTGLTDSTVGAATLHDVGTLRDTSGSRLGGLLPGIDTPTLLGLWNTAPYFHDGSAETLEDIFSVAGGASIQAESGAVSGGAAVTVNYVDLNNDDTVHGRAFVGFNNAGARLTLSGVDGGSGGTGAIELRYSSGYRAHTVHVEVNGIVHVLAPEETGNDPDWRHTSWATVRVEDVTLNAGAVNTVAIITPDDFPNVSLDDIVLSTADDLAAALPHHQVLALPSGDRDALLAYLRQLDSQPEVDPTEILFEDGFESGNVSSWTAASSF